MNENNCTECGYWLGAHPYGMECLPYPELINTVGKDCADRSWKIGYAKGLRDAISMIAKADTYPAAGHEILKRLEEVKKELQ